MIVKFKKTLLNSKNSFLIKSVFTILFMLCVGYFSCGKKEGQKTYFPETGEKALYQRSLDLQNNVTVLTISLQPGYEDLSALAYLRLGLGATIMSAYVTNGEAGENDKKVEYPPYLADTHRREAFHALSFLNGEAYYMNLPDIAAARDEALCRELWSGNLLKIKLERLISQFRPNIILLCRDWAVSDISPRFNVLLDDLLDLVKEMSAQDSTNYSGAENHTVWQVDRIFVDSRGQAGLSVPVQQEHPLWHKTYNKIGEEAALCYSSLTRQRAIWMRQEAPTYHQVYPELQTEVRTIDENLGSASSPRLQSIDSKIKRLATVVRENSSLSDDINNQVIAIKDSVNHLLTKVLDLRPHETVLLTQWNSELEDLHNTLLGVEVKYTLNDTLLTQRQLTYLTINEVRGIKNSEKTIIYFTSPDLTWVINEKLSKEWPLKLNEEYRLLTTQDLVYNRPPGKFKFESSHFGSPLFFYIIHNDSEPAKRFIHRTKLNFEFAPKFMVEVLTPIVRMMSGERVVVRMTNLSRDGITDSIRVSDAKFSSSPRFFRIKTKENSVIDTLFFWANEDLEKGSYLVPLTIGGMTYGQFVVRNFDVKTDTTPKIGIVTGYDHSPIADALRRLGMKSSDIYLNHSFLKQIKSLDVLLIDRRALTLIPQITKYKEEIQDFVTKGGHLLILTQDAASWNAEPIYEPITLTPTVLFDPEVPLQIDSMHVLLTQPNRIEADDWNGWLFLRGQNVISCEAVNGVQFPIKAKEKDSPLIVNVTQGKGKITYVGLALTQQLMNVHPGAFKIFANIISY